VVTEQLSRSYGSTLALAGFSATFNAGSVTVLEGKNGAGKTTLLGVLSTLVRPSSGSVCWHPFGSDRSVVRPLIGWLTHEPTVSLDLSGIENLRWAARLYGLEVSAVEEIRARLGIGAFGRRAVRTMSRGQRQRIALGRALLHRPSLLLLDEPTTGLDQEGIARLLTLIRAEAASETIVIVVSHDPSLAPQLGARVIPVGRPPLASLLRPGVRP